MGAPCQLISPGVVRTDMCTMPPNPHSEVRPFGTKSINHAKVASVKMKKSPPSGLLSVHLCHVASPALCNGWLLLLKGKANSQKYPRAVNLVKNRPWGAASIRPLLLQEDYLLAKSPTCCWTLPTLLLFLSVLPPWPGSQPGIFIFVF